MRLTRRIRPLAAQHWADSRCLRVVFVSSDGSFVQLMRRAPPTATGDGSQVVVRADAEVLMCAAGFGKGSRCMEETIQGMDEKEAEQFLRKRGLWAEGDAVLRELVTLLGDRCDQLDIFAQNIDIKTVAGTPECGCELTLGAQLSRRVRRAVRAALPRARCAQQSGGPRGAGLLAGARRASDRRLQGRACACAKVRAFCAALGAALLVADTTASASAAPGRPAWPRWT